jgi:hypothetical protein
MGTVKKSMETRSLRWLSRKAFQICDGDYFLLGISRETVRSETLIPSFANSPFTLGVLHTGDLHQPSLGSTL